MREERFLTIREVSHKVGFKTTTIYKYIKMGIFPKPVKIEKNSRWRLTEIEKWMQQVIGE